MNSTSPRPSKRVVWASGVLLSVLTYALLCMADELLARWLEHQTMTVNAPARALEAKRIEQQDTSQLAHARAEGWGVMLYPSLFDSGEFKRIAVRHGLVPLGTQPLTRLAFCNEGDGLVRYTSDRFGFRNPDAVWGNASIAVALLGDSYMQGACVGESSTVSARMARPDRPVVSLATSGNNALLHAAVARAYLPTLRPRHAVLVFYANDNDDEEANALRTLAFPDQPEYIRRTANELVPGSAYGKLKPLWAEAEAEAQRQLRASGSAGGNGAFADWLVRRRATLTLPTIRKVVLLTYRRWQRPELAWSSRLAIDTLAAQCADVGCKPMLVYIPNSEFWRPDPRADGYRQLLKSYIEARYPGMPWVDTTPLLAVLGRKAYAVAGGHLSVAGYAVVAQGIEQHLAP